MECRIWSFRESNFQKFSRGACSQNPLSVIDAFGAGSQLAFPVSSSAWCLIFMPVTKTQYLDKTNDDTESVWRRSLNAKGTIHVQNETKLPLRKIIKSMGVQKSSWILNLEKSLVGIMNHWGKNEGNHEYQDSNDSASTTDCLWWQQRIRISIINFNSKEARPLN